MIKIFLKKKLSGASGSIHLDVNFQVKPGELVSVFGESGAGKTTILRMIAGLTLPDEGLIQIDDEVWFDSHRKINRPVQQRKIGFVFQEYSLFPNMTARQNLEFALHQKNDQLTIDELLDLVGMSELQNQYPHQLSGGQKQRIALLRTLIRKPKLLLLDEPLSSLDFDWRMKIQDEIVRLHQKIGFTAILVSHDVPEVFKLSREVFILDQGRIIKSGKPSEVFFQNQLSSKIQLTGYVLEIKKEGVINTLVIQIGSQMVKVVATDEEISGLKIGDKVLVASKAFNPLIIKTI